MQDAAPVTFSGAVTDKFRTPHVTIVIPHFDYAEFVGDALQSVLEQSYRNFSCVVVDDCSSSEHAARLETEMRRIRDERFVLVRQPRNRGMIHAIYRGMDERPSSFLAILDPDDRYDPRFLQKMLDVHLNRHIFCPLVSCDQHLFQMGDGIITSTQYTNRYEVLGTAQEAEEEACFARYGFHSFVPPLARGWHWSSTSSMMFRSDALRLFRPVKDFPYKGQGDDYCANGAHMLGGSLILREPLVYRGIHTKNDFITNSIFSMWQRQERAGGRQMSDVVKIDLVESFFANGGQERFAAPVIREVLMAQFEGEEREKLARAVPMAAELMAAAG